VLNVIFSPNKYSPEQTNQLQPPWLHFLLHLQWIKQQRKKQEEWGC